ncbi:hypothetical protein [Paenibacillus periandrae]|uniref:hypothetical protein n=1 Tax=Paenibacillus periandrae TaxID=1761741 RepID=UPI001F095C55|nr:hypothetical protein [Paenibacillus periandrae]
MRKVRPSIGRFLNHDTYEGDIKSPLSLNQYTYGHNNPNKFGDPSGHIVDTIADVVFIAYDVYVLATDPSWENASYIVTISRSFVLA